VAAWRKQHLPTTTRRKVDAWMYRGQLCVPNGSEGISIRHNRALLAAAALHSMNKNLCKTWRQVLDGIGTWSAGNASKVANHDVDSCVHQACQGVFCGAEAPHNHRNAHTSLSPADCMLATVSWSIWLWKVEWTQAVQWIQDETHMLSAAQCCTPITVCSVQRQPVLRTVSPH
jgi:hypothetical protein